MIQIDKCLRFNAKKMRDKEIFSQRYAPVIEYWMSRISKGLTVVSNTVQFFDQNGDDFIKNIITVRVRMMIKEPDDKRSVARKAT